MPVQIMLLDFESGFGLVGSQQTQKDPEKNLISEKYSQTYFSIYNNKPTIFKNPKTKDYFNIMSKFLTIFIFESSKMAATFVFKKWC